MIHPAPFRAFSDSTETQLPFANANGELFYVLSEHRLRDTCGFVWSAVKSDCPAGTAGI